eukprot:2023702-Amphidinium_carterae.1
MADSLGRCTSAGGLNFYTWRDALPSSQNETRKSGAEYTYASLLYDITFQFEPLSSWSPTCSYLHHQDIGFSRRVSPL